MIVFITSLLGIAYFSLVIHYAYNTEEDCECNKKWEFKFIKYYSPVVLSLLILQFFYTIVLFFSNNLTQIWENNTTKFAMLFLIMVNMMAMPVYFYAVFSYIHRMDERECPKCSFGKKYEVMKYSSIVYAVCVSFSTILFIGFKVSERVKIKKNIIL